MKYILLDENSTVVYVCSQYIDGKNVNEIYPSEFLDRCIKVADDYEIVGSYYNTKTQLFYNKPLESLLKEIDNQVINKIREKYDQNEEFKMLRLGVANPSNEEFLLYSSYVEECRGWGQSEKNVLV